jgi:Cu/Ag efflux pump CusA
MISWIVGSSVRFRLLVIGGAAAALLIGATQLRNARVDILPEFTPPYVEIQTEALGLSAEEVEELITVPLEADLLNGVAFLQEIRSESIAGLSSIVMTFEPGTDIYRARQVVAERLTQAHALPNVSKPPEMLQPLSSSNRVMMVSLRSSEMPLIDMSVLARWTMRPRLMGVPGVANVSIWGERNRQIQVLVDPEELEAQGVSLGDVIRTTGNSLWVSSLTFLEASTPGTGGFIDTPNQRLGIQHTMPIRNAADLARVAVESEDGSSGHLRLGDLATVVEGHQPLIGDAVLDEGDGLLLVIEKFPGVNTLDVTRRIDAALDAMTPGLGGMEIDSTIFRPANFIEAAIGNIGLSLLLGFLLVAFVFGAVLFDWRAAVVSLVTIPLSLAAATLVLHHAGASLNVMILAGLVVAIAVVVDDASTGVSAVVHRLRHPRPDDAERRVDQLVIEATIESRGPIVYATMIILATLVPVFFIGGSVGLFLPPMAVAYAVAVLASFGVSLTVAPAMAVLLLSRGSGDGRPSPILDRLRASYQTTLSAILKRARPSHLTAGFATVALAATVGLVILLQTQASLVPAFRAREVLIQWDGAAGTSHPEQARIVAQAGAELRALDGVANVGSHVGRAILSDQVASVSRGEIWVTIDPSADYDRTMASIRETVSGYPGLSTAVATYPEDRIARVTDDGRSDVTVRVYGQDLPILEERAEAIRQAVAGVAGVSAATIDSPPQEASLEVAVDLEAAASRGVKAGDVRRIVTTLLSGLEVGLLFEEQKVFEVVVWGKPELRDSISAVEDLLIETPSGDLIRLDDLADVRVAPTPTVISREGVMRIVDVGASVGGRDIGSVMTDINEALADVAFPLEYHAEVFAAAAAQQEAQLRLVSIIAAAALLSLLLFQAAFGRWRLSLLVFLTIPAALAGGLVTGALGGELMSLGTLGGVFAVLAISVRLAMSLIDHLRQIERVEGAEFGPALVVRGAQDRLGPTLMTTFGTAVAVVPFVALGNVAGLEIARPMATFVLGGLFTSTLIALFVLPKLYLESGPRQVTDTEELLAEERSGLQPTTA